VAAAPPASPRASAPPAEPSRDAQRAQAILEGKSAAAPAEGASTPASAARGARFVVQAGAYTDSAALREARQKVEKLGLKTYTQVIETESGSRTRVRVGPFDTREEAEKAAARIKGSGVAANILSL
jgi:DedD protein